MHRDEATGFLRVKEVISLCSIESQAIAYPATDTILPDREELPALLARQIEMFAGDDVAQVGGSSENDVADEPRGDESQPKVVVQSWRCWRGLISERLEERQRSGLTLSAFPAGVPALAVHRKMPTTVIDPPIVSWPAPLFVHGSRHRCASPRSSGEPSTGCSFRPNFIPPLLVLMHMLDSPGIEPILPVCSPHGMKSVRRRAEQRHPPQQLGAKTVRLRWRILKSIGRWEGVH